MKTAQETATQLLRHRVMTKPLRQLTEIDNCLPNAILSWAKNYLEETLKYFSRYMNRIVMQMEFIN